MKKTRLLNIIFGILFLYSAIGISQNRERKSLLTIARIKYQGGGDWYNDPTAIPNLLQFIKRETTIQTALDEKKVEIMDQELFSYPILFMTGHGKIFFSEEEAKRLRNYLIHGGFLLADDDYGMDNFFKAAMKKVFPDKDLVELPFYHPIYNSQFSFDNGLPKIHEHDGGPPQGYGIFNDGRMVVFYTYNTNISDGWADPEVHKDPQQVRLQALKMGTNIIVYVLTN
jgi:hypothetical protein